MLKLAISSFSPFYHKIRFYYVFCIVSICFAFDVLAAVQATVEAEKHVASLKKKHTKDKEELSSRIQEVSSLVSLFLYSPLHFRDGSASTSQ